MTQYTFTCPLEGCSTVMTTQVSTEEEGAKALVAQAKAHLASVHPEVHKTDEEVDKDIRSHMIAKA